MTILSLFWSSIHLSPFPHMTILQQTTLNIFCQIWAISSFVTMFSKSRLLQRRQKVSIWGKGLRPFPQTTNMKRKENRTLFISVGLYIEHRYTKCKIYNTSHEKIKRTEKKRKRKQGVCYRVLRINNSHDVTTEKILF